MSDTKKSQENGDSPVDPGDLQLTERVLERLAFGWDPQSAAVLDEADAEVREHMTALGALAYDAEPVTPSASTRSALLDRIGAMGQGAVEDPAAPAAPLPFSPRGTISPETAASPTGRSAANDESRGFMVWALAAGLAFCLVGLGYTFGQLNAKDAVIAMQQERLEALPDLEDELRLVRDDLRRSRDQLVMVNTVARTAYPMRFVSTAGQAQDRRPPAGRVFVCGAHQQWYATLSGLEAPPTDRAYHFWFLTAEGAVSAGSFEVEDGRSILRDLRMPEGTHGFTVTLEPMNGAVEASALKPRGNTILVGDQPVSL